MIISKMTSAQIRIVYVAIHGVFLTVVKVLGVLGDAVTLLVLSRRGMRNTLTPILQAMVMTDLLTLLVCVPAHVLFAIKGRNLDDQDPIGRGYLLYIYYILTAMLIASSSWLVLTVAIYRYIATRFPFHSKRLCSKKRSRIAIIIIIILSGLTNLPRFYTVLNSPAKSNETTQAAQLYKTATVASDIASLMLAIIIPWFLCMLFMILTQRAVKSARDTLSQCVNSTKLSSSAKSVEIQLTNTFTTILMVFMVLVFPQAVRHAFRTLVGIKNWYNGTILYVVIDSIADVTLFVYFSINFLLYTTTSGMFRAHFKHWVRHVTRRLLCRLDEEYDLDVSAISRRESEFKTVETSAGII